MIEKPFQLGAGGGVKFVSSERAKNQLVIQYEIDGRRYGCALDLPNGTPLELAKAARRIGVIARAERHLISGDADRELAALIGVGRGRFNRIKKFL